MYQINKMNGVCVNCAEEYERNRYAWSEDTRALVFCDRCYYPALRPLDNGHEVEGFDFFVARQSPELLEALEKYSSAVKLVMEIWAYLLGSSDHSLGRRDLLSGVEYRFLYVERSQYWDTDEYYSDVNVGMVFQHLGGKVTAELEFEFIYPENEGEEAEVCVWFTARAPETGQGKTCSYRAATDEGPLDQAFDAFKNRGFIEAWETMIKETQDASNEDD